MTGTLEPPLIQGQVFCNDHKFIKDYVYCFLHSNLQINRHLVFTTFTYLLQFKNYKKNFFKVFLKRIPGIDLFLLSKLHQNSDMDV